MGKKEYKLKIGFEVLRLLGPSLYTNIYYIMGELIANAYDADAENIYITQSENQLRVEDDGLGMSYETIKNVYLNVGVETRTSKKGDRTPKGRRKIGRKGIGKLAAIAVSNDVDIMTIHQGEKNGFVLFSSEYLKEDKDGNQEEDKKILEAIPEDNINFLNIKEQGTAVVMKDKLKYSIKYDPDEIRLNFLKLFDCIGPDFKIHIEIEEEDKISIGSTEEDIVKEMGTIITLGKEFEQLANNVTPIKEEPDKKEVPVSKNKTVKLVDTWPEHKEAIKLKNNNQERKVYNLIIKGWIGTLHKLPKRRPKESPIYFPERRISLFANKKLGEYDILPKISYNRIYEAYMVGQFHVDLFEETELPDMALSNRQGYKIEDERYQKVIEYIRAEIMPKALEQIVTRRKYENKKKTETKDRKKDEQIKKYIDDQNKKLNKQIKEIESNIKKDVSTLIGAKKDIGQIITDKTIHSLSKCIDIKEEYKKNDGVKKFLISHSDDDKRVATFIYDLLLFNNIPKEDILFSGANPPESRIPIDSDIYDYIRKVFVGTKSGAKLNVMFVTSSMLEKSWGAMVEIGAYWVTTRNKDSCIFNINEYQPKSPLDINKTWINIKWEKKDDDGKKEKISIPGVGAQQLHEKLGMMIRSLPYGYEMKSQEENINFIKEYSPESSEDPPPEELED